MYLDVNVWLKKLMSFWWSPKETFSKEKYQIVIVKENNNPHASGASKFV
jgi:hypothetical protein